MNVAVVVPTIRPDCIKKFLSEWEFPDGTTVYVVEDNPKKSDIGERESVIHYSWKEIDGDLGENSWIIPRRADCIRSYGFYRAYVDGADVIITLDDDCYPMDANFVGTHLDKLYQQIGRWAWTTRGLKPRGVPYKNLGSMPVMINMGFWRGVADMDGPTQLVFGAKDLEPNIMNPVPPKYYYPMCGMNVAFKRAAVPMMYFLLMGEEYPYDRFGDIWCGLIAKKICDHLGYCVTVGSPSINHSRASNVFANVKKEAPGLEVNEKLWEHIDGIELEERTILGCYREVATAFFNIIPDKNERAYWMKLYEAMLAWTELFYEDSNDRPQGPSR